MIENEKRVPLPSLDELIESALEKFKTKEFEVTYNNTIESYETGLASWDTIQKSVDSGADIENLARKLIKETRLLPPDLPDLVDDLRERCFFLLSVDILDKELIFRFPEFEIENKRRIQKYDGIEG